MPVAFAREVLRLWEEFEKILSESTDAELRELGELTIKMKRKALQGAANVFISNVALNHAKERNRELKNPFL